MTNPIINFLKKIYMVLIIIFTAIIFFLGYNTYLVDRSLANLRIALYSMNNIRDIEDAKKLSKVLDATLIVEIGSKDLSVSNVSKLEMAKDILKNPEIVPKVENRAKKICLAIYSSLLEEVAEKDLQDANVSKLEVVKDILKNPQDVSQLETAKSALKEIIKDKEQKRSPILLALDRINGLFAPTVKRISKAQLENQATQLKNRLKLLKDKNQIQEVYYELANTYTQLSEFDKARETYSKAADLNPDSKLGKKSQFNLAWNEKIRGNSDEAIKEFEALVQSNIQDELSVFSKYQMADAFRQKGDFEKAAAIYKEVAAEVSGSDLAQTAKMQEGYIYLYDLKKYEKAKEVFSELKKQTKNETVAVRMETITSVSVGIAYRKEGFKLLNEGYYFSSAERYKEALKYFDKALEVNPKDGASYVGKALAYLWLKDEDKAMFFARKAVILSPTDEIASVNLGFIYIELNLVNEAILEFKRFISIYPFTSHGYYNLGYAYAVAGKIEDATKAFYQATKIDPKFVGAYNNLGWCYWYLNQFDPAVRAFERAVEIKPDFTDALFNLGMCYKTVGRYREAKEKFQSVLELKPNHAEAKENLKEIEKVNQ